MPNQKKKRLTKRQKDRKKERLQMKEELQKEKENYVIVNGKKKLRCQGITAKGKRCARAAYVSTYVDTLHIPIPSFSEDEIKINNKQIPIKCCRLCRQHSAMAATHLVGRFMEWYQYKDWTWDEWQQYQCATNPEYIDQACQKMEMFIKN